MPVHEPTVLLGRSRAIQRVRGQVRRIAGTRAAVLIEGARGAGKARLAEAIHRAGPRRDRPFVRVRGDAEGGAIQAALFGLAARTGAAARRGALDQAAGGTLYVEEVGALAPAVQVLLLRALQDRAYERVGGSQTLKTESRVIAGTSEDLAARVRAGRFREDLYERLSAVRIAMPSLRERAEDLPELIARLLQENARAHGRRAGTLTPGALERLAGHEWTGNLPELRVTIDTMVAAAGPRRVLDLSDLPEALRGAGGGAERLELAVGMTVEEAERRLIAATLRHVGNDKPRAAALLGIGLRTLYRKIEQYRLR
jgi:DNA-binding NtrC family response regulator